MSLDLFWVLLFLPNVCIVVDFLGSFDGAYVGAIVVRVGVLEMRVEVLLGSGAAKGAAAGGVGGAAGWWGGGDSGLTVHDVFFLFFFPLEEERGDLGRGVGCGGKWRYFGICYSMAVEKWRLKTTYDETLIVRSCDGGCIGCFNKPIIYG